ncbi:hypothetical protein Q0590_07615 [Rhodocytophaga aerolata]|uniref:TerB family tellurite resistance protein n=1 Tax=Rhodocytophaga aerolata TaxID=455078 RepID=A0ABT8R4G3_9BACT|nr:hypothetical protein [Rhodocytophaga aerolata]MDO1446113.1 hypothetical protein [Rhodocytophaga aerolata]
MKENIAHWTYQNFQAFLLLYAASSDLAIKPEEVDQLLEKTGYTAYKEVLPVFQQQSDYERLQTILYFKPTYFANEAEVDRLIKEIQEMYQQDHHFSHAEQGILLLLKKIL